MWDEIDKWFSELRTGLFTGPVPAKSFHAKLFRVIVRDMRLNHAQWMMLEERFVNDPLNGLDVSTSRKRFSARLKLRRKLTVPTMTRKQFELALTFLNPAEVNWIENGIELKWDNGRTTTHRWTPGPPREIEA